MKYLLHSRKFRSTVFKWLFCYIGTMILFTAVVTYSRYITTKAASDNARVAKFDVTISKICYDKESANPDSCANEGEFRAKEKNSFYFTVDTTEMEVTSTFVTRIVLSSKFSSDSENVFIYMNDKVNAWVPLKDIKTLYPSMNIKFEGNVITITEAVIASQGEKRRYRVDATYDNFGNDERLSGVDIGEAITVGFSATQKK